MDRHTRSVLEGVDTAAKQLDRGWQEPPPGAGTVPAVTENVVETEPTRPRHNHLALALLAAALTASGIVAGALLLRGGSTPALPAPSGRPALVSQAQLERFAASVDYPVYWAGPRAGFSYELTAAKDRVWVRYLPAGVRAGDPRPKFLVIGTYKQPQSYSGLKKAASQAGSVSERIPDGGLLVYSAARPTSVYFSYPGVKYQVEVFAPSPETARSMVVDGKTTALR